MSCTRTVRSMLMARLKTWQELGLERHVPVFADEDRGADEPACGRRGISFLSNDYLGLASDRRWQQQVAECFAVAAPSASASRLAGGHRESMCKAEQELADYFGHERALLVSSGYQGNAAIVAGLVQPGQPVFVDKRIHASTAHALAGSGARILPYRHADMDHLRRRLETCAGPMQPMVFTESLFSMDGTLTDVQAILALKRRYGFFLVADEAHALGCLGPGGRGLFAGHAGEVDVILGTLGKGLGLFGAFVLLTQECARALEHFASPIVHSTALPPAHALACSRLVKLLPTLEEERQRLAASARFLRKALQERGCTTLGQAHIVALPLGQEERARKVSLSLQRQGIHVLAARFPTVPVHQALLRLSVTTRHTEDMLQETARCVALSLQEA